jgi:hypothetical protein
MRKINIDKDLLDEVDTFCNTLFLKRNSGFVLPKAKLENLKNKIKPRYTDYKRYVQRIIDKYPALLKADPDEMNLFISEFKNDFPSVVVSKKIPYKNVTFHDAIVEAMRYDALREKEYLDYLQKKAYKACVYCNANSTLVIDFQYFDAKKKRKIKSRRARLELDHFYPKSKYPFLCTSFFNLYPVCGSCNRSKGDKLANFQLYTKFNQLDSFTFWIDDLSIIQYWNNKGIDNSQIKVQLLSTDGDLNLLKNHNDLFQVEEIANCNLDLAEELIHKAIVYNNSYKKSLVDSFKTLFPDQTIINRLLIGNYDNPEDVHKRPMAKFTQDIARQLGLI